MEVLLKKYPFIYEINDKFYYIGVDLFEECKDEYIIKLYLDFTTEVDEFKNNNFWFEKQYEPIFDEVLTLYNKIYDSCCEKKVFDMELFKMMEDNLSNKAKEKIDSDVKDWFECRRKLDCKNSTWKNNNK